MDEAIETTEAPSEAVETPKSGHMSKEDWVADGKDPEAWVSEGEYERRGELFDSIKQQGKRIKNQDKTIHDLKSSIDALVEQQQTIVEKTRASTLKELELQQEKAVEEGDTARFKEIKAEIKEIETQPVAEPSQQFDPRIDEWTERNDWFRKDAKLSQYAMAAFNENMSKGMDLEDALDAVEQEVKTTFPKKFSNQPSSPDVLPKAGNKVKTQVSESDLDPVARQVWNTLKGNPKNKLTLEDYIKQIGE